MIYVCDNCSSEWTKDDLDVVDNIEDRVMPGEPMPAGQCPKCGSVLSWCLRQDSITLII